MKKIYLFVLLTTAAVLAACGSGAKPNVKAVRLTEPWTTLNLPCKNDAVVVVSNENRFNCAYGGVWSVENELKTITQYVELLKNSGWKTTDQSKKGAAYLFEKNGKEIVLFPTASSINTDEGTIRWEGIGIQADYRNKGE